MKTSKLVWLSAVGLVIQVVCIVNGNYIVEVRTHSYNNPTSRLANGDCCDSIYNLCAVPGCDNVFHYCLRSLDSSGDGCNGGRFSQEVNSDDAPLNFSQPTVLGLPNPLPLRGLSTVWTGVQFYLDVKDHDGGQLGTGELVGRVVNNIFSSNITLGVETEPQNFSYPNPPVRSSIVLSFKVVCAENYYGQNCSRLCTENCTCDPGFTGEFCHEIDDCYRVNCGTNRQCIDGVNNHTCVCNPGYTGENCDVNIDDCQAMIINCSGRGQCLDGINAFTCECDAGYAGKYCEVEINKCLNITCSGNGQCVNEGNSYSCVCDPNFTGEICSEEMLTTETETETETGTQAPGRNFNLKAVLGGTIGALIFLVLLLLLIVGVMTFKLATRRQKRKLKHHALSASTDVLEMEENETYVEMIQAPTMTINNMAYEGVTTNDEETEGATQYTNGDFQSDTNIYECI